MLHSLVFSNCQCEIDVEIYAIFFQYVQRLSISINFNLLFKLLMGTNGVWKRSKNENLEKLTVPPGLMSHTSFLFKKVENCEESCNTSTHLDQTNTLSGTVDDATLKRSCRNRPWILYEQDNLKRVESKSRHPVKVRYLFLLGSSVELHFWWDWCTWFCL